MPLGHIFPLDIVPPFTKGYVVGTHVLIVSRSVLFLSCHPSDMFSIIGWVWVYFCSSLHTLWRIGIVTLDLVILCRLD